MRTFLALSLAAFALTGCAGTAERPTAPSWFVMRHLQKGEGTDPGLTPQGHACAARLAERLAHERIGAIYVSTTRRAQQSAAPLAARLAIAPHSYDPADTRALVARLRAETGPTLVVGHSNTVPEIVEQLGGARPAPIADESYGDVWHVSGGRTVASRIEGC